MKTRILVLVAAALLLHAAAASAQSVKLEFVNGRVNLSAQNAPIGAILAEWTRLGGTNIVNGDRVTGAPVTLELQGVPERQALDIILRGVAGYMLAARETNGGGASHFDRVMILPTSSAPRATPATTATFSPPPPRPFEDDFDDDVDDDVDITTLRERDQEAVRRAEELARQRALDRANRVTAQPVVVGPGGVTRIDQAFPFVPGAQPPAEDGPVQQPGQAPPRPSNPFTTLPGTARPGEVTPAPRQENRVPDPEQ